MYANRAWKHAAQHYPVKWTIADHCAAGLCDGPDGGRVLRSSEFWASTEVLLQDLRTCKCDGGHTHPAPGLPKRENRRWPVPLCMFVARSCARVLAYPNSASGAGDDAAEPPPDWVRCLGCLRGRVSTDPDHDRIPGRCKYPLVETIEWQCPACQRHEPAASERHTNIPGEC